MGIEFIMPDFISDHDPQEIQDRMMNSLPPGIDRMPGGFPYDFTMPTALEKSELIQFHLVRTLMLMFPEWAWGEYLDLHGRQVGLQRKEAIKASGQVLVEGSAGTILPSGFQVGTTAGDTVPSVTFVTEKEYVIPETGSIEIHVTAELAGAQSNVSANTVTLTFSHVVGITNVCNRSDMTGGTDAEGDEELRQRIIEVNQSKESSFVGNDSDYIRWAKQIQGVGNVVVVPEWNGPGTVKLVLTDGNGQLVKEAVREEVYKYIVSPQDRIMRLAPIGADVTVADPDLIRIHYAAKLILLPGYHLDEVKASFQRNLQKLYEISKEEHMLRYNHAVSFLIHTEGVSDFQDFTIEEGTENVPLALYEYPDSNLDGIEEVNT